MRLGPFSPFDIDHLKELFEAKAIQFEIEIDEATLTKLTEKYHDGGRFFRAGNKVLWIEIEDSNFNLIAKEIEKYGIVAPSDGSYELGTNSEED